MTSNKNNLDLKEGISIITPSYKGENYITKLLESMKNQTLSNDLFEHIVIINGEKDRTTKIIEGFKDKNPHINIKLFYSEIANASNARNIGIEHANRRYCTFVDDDDHISPNFLIELYKNAAENRVVISGFLDVNEKNDKISHSYVTPELLNNSGIVKDAYSRLVGALTIDACKLLPTDKIKQLKYNEKLKSGIDVAFYCKLYAKNKFEFYVIDKEKKAIYYRLYRENSMSRRPLSYEFNVLERLSVIKDLNNSIKITKDTSTQNFIKNKIIAQISYINRYLNKNPHKIKKICRDISENNLDYFPYNHMNKNLAKKLVISYNFPPYADTSGITMAKRIHQNADIVDVIHNKMERDIDEKLNLIVDEFIDKKILINSAFTFGGWDGIKQFCKLGMEEINKILILKGEYEEIYSRAMFPASHFLAFQYKMEYPNVKWTAEFSDPLIYDIKGDIRNSKITDKNFMGNLNKILSEIDIPKCENDNLFFLCEYLPYLFADEIIFTNKNQKEYMISKFPIKNIKNKIKIKSRIMRHPTLKKKFYNLIESNYQLDHNCINLAYFGSFYETRNLDDIFYALYSLDDNLKNKCKIHFFTSDINGFNDSIKCSPIKKNLEINPYVNFLEFLNLTTKFDCLIVGDAKMGEINPYLPSKLSDYLGSENDIWMINEENSAMSKFNLKYKSILGDIKSTRQTLQKIIEDKSNEFEG